MTKLAIIVPCYNEEEILPLSIKTFTEYIKMMIDKNIISEDSFVCFVDDGSKDKTWDIISSNSNNILVNGLKLSNNFGHQNALLAGLFYNKDKADVYITIDCDLQDDINTIEKMLYEYENSNVDIVYGVRDSRESDTLFKRKSAELFYDLQLKLGVDIIKNHADFRLITNNVLNQLENFQEVNIYLRAIFPLMGFENSKVFYDRKERVKGESKYPLKKMLIFAWDGITSFSVAPIRLITILGVFSFLASFFMVFYILFIKFFTYDAIPGWASTTIPIYFIGGIQLLSLGIVGEYIGKIYKEVKQRPRYIIEKGIENAKKS